MTIGVRPAAILLPRALAVPGLHLSPLDPTAEDCVGACGCSMQRHMKNNCMRNPLAMEVFNEELLLPAEAQNQGRASLPP